MNIHLAEIVAVSGESDIAIQILVPVSVLESFPEGAFEATKSLLGPYKDTKTEVRDGHLVITLMSMPVAEVRERLRGLFEKTVN